MNGGLEALRERVIDRGLCVSCGACVSLCPYLRSWQTRTVVLDQCDLGEGRCADYCPRMGADLDDLHRRLFGVPYQIEMGTVRKVFMARAVDSLWGPIVQNGGVVSALVDFAMGEGTVNAAVLTERGPGLQPSGRIARNREDVLACAGSTYASGPTLEALNRGPWNGEERIGVVGLPCMVQALARMKVSDLDKRTPIDHVDLVIGLFCTWALDYKRFGAFLRERFRGLPLSKVDITPPPERLMEVSVGDDLHQIPLDEIRRFIREGCRVCPDMTAEFSDLSIGTVEGEEGWNTVLVRTEKGDGLIKRALEKGVIESLPLSGERLDHLREASILKKIRAMEVLMERDELGLGYLGLSGELIARLKSEFGEE